MKRVLSLFVAVALLLSGYAVAEEIKSGPEEGAAIEPFYVTKCAGAEEDGVDVGKNLCYRCKNGTRPQVMVFTRSSDEKVIALVKKIDEQIKKHEDAQLRAFVNVMGDSKDAAMDEAKKMASAAKTTMVPFVVPNEVENGPDNYGLNTKADVTITIANKGIVVSSHAVASAKDLDVEAVMSALEKALN